LIELSGLKNVSNHVRNARIRVDELDEFGWRTKSEIKSRSGTVVRFVSMSCVTQ